MLTTEGQSSLNIPEVFSKQSSSLKLRESWNKLSHETHVLWESPKRNV